MCNLRNHPALPIVIAAALALTGCDGSSPIPGTDLMGPYQEPPPTLLATSTQPKPFDQDGDGYEMTLDCDDRDPAVFPSAPETCNGQDDDCDGQIDERTFEPDGLGGDDAAVPDFAAALAEGTPEAPAALVLDMPGTLRLGPDDQYATLDVRADGVTIAGCAGEAVVDAAGAGRVLTVDGPYAVEIQGVTLTGGSAELGGGLLAADGADVAIVEGTIHGNRADDGGGIALASATVTITDGAVIGNTALGAGGGALVDADSVLESEGTDWGDGEADNEPDDVTVGDEQPKAYRYGADARFTCAGSSCD